MPEWVWKMALNAKTKKDGDSKGLKECAQWLWMPKWREMVVDLDVEQKNRHENSECWTKDDFERQIENVNSEHQLKVWLWNPNWKCDGSRCRNENTALNVEMRLRIWTPNGKWTMALNAKTKTWLWMSKWDHDSERQMENEQWLWMSKWDYGSERQTKNE